MLFYLWETRPSTCTHTLTIRLLSICTGSAVSIYATETQRGVALWWCHCAGTLWHTRGAKRPQKRTFGIRIYTEGVSFTTGFSFLLLAFFERSGKLRWAVTQHLCVRFSTIFWQSPFFSCRVSNVHLFISTSDITSYYECKKRSILWGKIL